MIARLLYTLALHLLLPLIGLRLLWRARRQRGYLDQFFERFGLFGGPSDAPLIWVHAVSVGETRAAEPLIRQLLAAYPAHRILLTHMTVTGRATSGELFGRDHPRLTRAYLPYDYPWAVAAFLRHFRPQLGLIMETELWPNLFAACRAHAVPLVLINARLSEKSARGYRRVLPLVRGCLASLDLVAAQSEEDAARLRALGAGKVEVLGNLKFDIDPPPDKIALGEMLRNRIGQRPVLLAASTREGEEEAILDAFRGAPPEVLLLLVPRHPQRFDAVAAMVAARGLTLGRRSDAGPISPQTRVLLGDSMGEMFAYYTAADVAFVGGSLVPLGGQNLIEACAVGTPVLVGPHTFNFDAVSREAIDAKAARRVEDAQAMIDTALKLLVDEDARINMAAAGRVFAGAHRGASVRLVRRVAEFLR